MIEGTEKAEVPSKLAKRTARYNELRYHNKSTANVILLR